MIQGAVDRQELPMPYLCELNPGQVLYLSHQGPQTRVTLATLRPGHQQQSSSCFSAGGWTAPPEVFCTPMSVVVRLHTDGGDRHLQIQGGSISWVHQSSPLRDDQRIQVEFIDHEPDFVRSSMTSSMPMEPMSMNDMSMGNMRMNDTHMNDSTKTSTAADNRSKNSESGGMKMGNMQMSMNPMEMRMGDMELRMGDSSSNRSTSTSASSASASSQFRSPSENAASSAHPRRFCSQCGAPITLGDRFCASCGTRLVP